jgi:transcription initiation factor TFIID subunit 13
MKDTRKCTFYKEVRQMMHGFGDSNTPRMDSVEVLHNYLIDYLCILLTKTHSMAKIKGKTKTEDLMYFLKRGRKKYSRVKHLLLLNEKLKAERKVFDKEEYEKEE